MEGEAAWADSVMSMIQSTVGSTRFTGTCRCLLAVEGFPCEPEPDLRARARPTGAGLTYE